MPTAVTALKSALGSRQSSNGFCRMPAKRRLAAVRSRKTALSALNDSFGQKQTLVKNSSMIAARTKPPYAHRFLITGRSPEADLHCELYILTDADQEGIA